MENSPINSAEARIFTEIKTEKVYVQVVNQIRDLIKAGRLSPGDKLPPEKVLAGRLGVSRPSIREGIVALEILGFVESRGGKGNFIRSIINYSALDKSFGDLEKEESPFELIEARKIIEVEVAGCAAKKATDEDIERIKQSLDRMGELIEDFLVNNNYEKPSEFDRQFHMDVAEATHNTVLQRIVMQLLEGLKEDLWVRLKGKSWSTPGRPQRYLKEHQAVLLAIQNRDSEMARKKMHKHLKGIQMDLFGEV